MNPFVLPALSHQFVLGPSVSTNRPVISFWPPAGAPIGEHMSTTASTPNSWLQNAKSGFLVFLIALPLSLGIAMASGFPPVAGIITASIGGIVVSWLGSARLTIKGPAAGLIVIALGAVQELGQGDAVLGYRRALAVGVAAALLQIILALVRGATVGIAMSPSVVHGMLAAIGVIIMSKQVHTVVGVNPVSKSPLQLLAEIPHSVAHANPEILLIGGLSLAILFLHPQLKQKKLKAIPAPVLVLLVAVPLGLFFDIDHAHSYHLWSQSFEVGPEYLVTLPSSILSALTFPDFSMITSMVSLKYIIMFALVGSIESVLSVLAVDSLDPERKASNLNRDLFATGVGNLLASVVGGLPMISEIVRSKANIDAGATSSRSNFAHGLLLALAVALVPSLLHQIPLAALAAMLVYTGARLASLNEFVHAKKIGNDQLLLFMTTLLVTLATDLLAGVAAGLVLKVFLHWRRGMPLSLLFRTHVKHEKKSSTLNVQLVGAASFASLLAVRRAFDQVDDQITRVEMDLTQAILVDHTFLTRVQSFAQEWNNTELCLLGLEQMNAASDHPTATRKRAV